MFNCFSCYKKTEGLKRRVMTTKLLKWRNPSISLDLINRSGIVFNLRFLHDGPDTVEELLDRHVVKKEKSLDDEEEELLNRRRLTSTRREALQLYRDILRATRFFMWPDSGGVLWRDILRENARKEFEEARFEKDPEVVTRLIIGGREAVESAIEKLVEKQRQQIEKERGGNDNRDRH
ncbi:uncharacterized protein LOC8288122 [Ricinus communis]|uniref:uncharacterized protein LOC8288122 n=1 Tax=Ricinus communis TaxID=3988 RepID=UPI0007726782|nr:uncharacterized protein LOC8288122 [Ricinus communis]XP_015574343.1 uncharacterized protein LOC8288122 [Ricinus communis]XP_048231732.1 uncharacterized protein LOC8288122 [Ricinus communis]|eukprot:XP_015574342.1 uncharacterized protein LOC8288122 [Ricinus communis]